MFGSMYYPTPELSPKKVSEVRQLIATSKKKSKASLTISTELLEATDALAGETGRSAFVERALRLYIERTLRRVRDERDRQLIDARANATNRESDELLALQAWP